MSDVTVSHHFLRRRARAKQARLEAQAEADAQARVRNGHSPERRRFRVEKAQRGPYRWRVVRVR